MDKEIIELWNNGKENLRKFLKTHEQSEYDDYNKLVKILICECLNKANNWHIKLFSDKFEVSDHGSHNGVQIFILHKETWFPELKDYYIFDNEYGSCTGSDALLEISNEQKGLPTDKQVSQYMNLCLQMCQRMKCLDELLND